MEDVEYEIELLRKLLSNLVPLVEGSRVAATDMVVELVLEEGVAVEEGRSRRRHGSRRS